MKKLVIAAIVLASMSTITSCRKSYSCECVTAYTDDNGDINVVSEVISIGEKMKEKQAGATCDQTEIQMNKVNDDLELNVANNISDASTACDLK